jgi:hypothetical protein
LTQFSPPQFLPDHGDGGDCESICPKQKTAVFMGHIQSVKGFPLLIFSMVTATQAKIKQALTH